MNVTNYYLCDGRLYDGNVGEIINTMMRRAMFFPGPYDPVSYIRWVVANLIDVGMKEASSLTISDDPDQASLQYLQQILPLTGGRFISDVEAQRFIQAKRNRQ